jgi:large subunit ribosomal protein L22
MQKKQQLIAKAYARYIRVSPRKLRSVIDLIRGKKVNQAFEILKNMNKRAKLIVEKALNSALSNARRNPQVLPDELFISKIIADQGPMLKRFRAQAMGRAAMIRRRTAHLSIELAGQIIKPVKQTKGKKKRIIKRGGVKK